MVSRYKSVVQEFESGLKHLRQGETRKTNYILQLNMRAYEKLQRQAR